MLVWGILAFAVLLSKTSAVSWPNFDNNDDSEEIFNENEDYADYAPEGLSEPFEDAWLENEHKASVLSGKYSQYFYDDDSDESRDLMSRNTLRSGNTKHCKEEVSGPHFLKEEGYHVRPESYHNISCVDSEDTSSISSHSHRKNGPLVLYCRANQETKRCVTMTKQINVFRKRIGHSCWQQRTKWVASGCQCR